MEGGCGLSASAGPEILFGETAVWAGEAQFAGMKTHIERRGATIEHSDCIIAVLELFEEHIIRGRAANERRHASQGILIDRNDRLVPENRDGRGAKSTEVGTENERRRHHGPKGKLASGFRKCHAGVATDNEVCVVPVSWLLKTTEGEVVGVVPHNAVKAIAIGLFRVVSLNVRTIAPELAVLPSPVEHVVPIRSALKISWRGFEKDDWPGDAMKGVAFILVRPTVRRNLALPLGDIYIAAVELQVIHSPGCEESGILQKMSGSAAFGPSAGSKPGASHIARIFVDPKFEAEGMDGVDDRLDTVRKFLRAGLQIALLVAVLLHPAVIDGDVLISARGEAGGDECVCVVKNGLRRVSALVVGPVIPPHGRGESERRPLCRWRCHGAWDEAAEQGQEGSERNAVMIHRGGERRVSFPEFHEETGRCKEKHDDHEQWHKIRVRHETLLCNVKPGQLVMLRSDF